MWTADHTCGRREAVDESGEQPEEQPNRLVKERVEETQSFAEEAEGRSGEEKKEEKDRTNSAVKTLCTSCCTLQTQQPQQQQQQQQQQQPQRCACSDAWTGSGGKCLRLAGTSRQ